MHIQIIILIKICILWNNHACVHFLIFLVFVYKLILHTQFRYLEFKWLLKWRSYVIYPLFILYNPDNVVLAYFNNNCCRQLIYIREYAKILNLLKYGIICFSKWNAYITYILTFFSNDIMVKIIMNTFHLKKNTNLIISIWIFSKN